LTTFSYINHFRQTINSRSTAFILGMLHQYSTHTHTHTRTHSTHTHMNTHKLQHTHTCTHLHTTLRCIKDCPGVRNTL